VKDGPSSRRRRVQQTNPTGPGTPAPTTHFPHFSIYFLFLFTIRNQIKFLKNQAAGSSSVVFSSFKKNFPRAAPLWQAMQFNTKGVFSCGHPFCPILHVMVFTLPFLCPYREILERAVLLLLLLLLACTWPNYPGPHHYLTLCNSMTTITELSTARSEFQAHPTAGQPAFLLIGTSLVAWADSAPGIPRPILHFEFQRRNGQLKSLMPRNYNPP